MPVARDNLPPVSLRYPRPVDEAELLAMNVQSRALHHPWIQPPSTADEYARYMDRVSVESEVGFFVCEPVGGRIVGVINLSNIIRGVFLSGYLSYYGSAACGRGQMTAGLAAVLDTTFGELGLHRVEANIQPNNKRSLALVRRCGFRREGYSPRYLYIDGQWRDHERWALLADEWPI